MRSVDHGYAALVKRVYGLRHPQIAVGILEADAPASKKHHKEKDGTTPPPGPQTVIEIATIMEFGDDVIPSRSFIRDWFDQASPAMKEELFKLLQLVVKGTRTKEDVLELVGQKAVGNVQKRIAAGIDPELKQATIDAKGSSTPLIDTGQTRSAVSYAVREGP